jgi:hypothetical protein
MNLVYNKEGLIDIGLCNFGSCIHNLREREMLETIAVILIVLWILGLATSYTMGGLIHGLLVIAIVVIVIRVIQGRSI